MERVQTARQYVAPFQRTANAAADWSTFFKGVEAMFDFQTAVTQFPSEKLPLFVEDYPRDRNGNYDHSFNVILWSCGGSQMAPSDNAGSRVPNGIELVEKVHSRFQKGYDTVTSRWREVMQADFSILSKSNAEGNFLTDWFHRSMMTYAFIDKFFSGYGVTYFKFEGRGPDLKTIDFGQDLYKRILSYSVRLDLLVVEQLKTLETASLTAGLPLSHESPDVFELTNF
jgi:hypothetical protein